MNSADSGVSANNYYRTAGKFGGPATRRENLKLNANMAGPGTANFSIYPPTVGVLLRALLATVTPSRPAFADVPYN